MAAMMCLSVGANAQDLLRYNYKKNGYTYTGAERQRVEGSTPMMLKLNRIIFPEGDKIYKLRVDFEDASAWKVPKNADFKATTSSGRTVLLTNEADEPTAVSPNGFNKNGKKVFWNYAEYYMEQADLDKMLEGVTSVEATKRFSSDGKINVSYKNNEFTSALKKEYEAIKNAPAPTTELGKHLKSVSDQNNNRLLETEQVSVSSQVAVALVYLYYAESNSENYDLNLYLQGTTVPYGNSITMTTPSGNMVFSQEKDLAAGRAICYPTIDQLKAMCKGVSKITVQTVSGPVTFNVDSATFGKTIETLYNSIQTASIL